MRRSVEVRLRLVPGLLADEQANDLRARIVVDKVDATVEARQPCLVRGIAERRERLQGVDGRNSRLDASEAAEEVA